MADNEEENKLSCSAAGAGETAAAAAEEHGVPQPATQTDSTDQAEESPAAAAGGGEGGPPGLTEFLQGCAAAAKTDDEEEESPLATHAVDTDAMVTTHMDGGDALVEQAVFAGTSAEYTTVSADIVNALSSNTTIIYVQPDGSFVEGSGLTAEEHQALVEQLTKQQIVQVSETEAARLFEHSQAAVKTAAVPQTSSTTTTTTQYATLAPSELQQVIDQVTKSQLQLQSPAAVPVQQHKTAVPAAVVQAKLEPQQLGGVGGRQRVVHAESRPGGGGGGGGGGRLWAVPAA